MKTIPITPIVDSASKFVNEHSTCASSALIALQVFDSSMAPELGLGHIVVVDRTGKLQQSSMVLVETHDSFLIRRWCPFDEENVELVPLNPLWNSQYFRQADVQLKGVVVQRVGRRRRERKRYA